MVKVQRTGSNVFHACEACSTRYATEAHALRCEGLPHIKIVNDLQFRVLLNLMHATIGSAKDLARQAQLTEAQEDIFRHVRAELVRSGVLQENGTTIGRQGRGRTEVRNFAVNKKKIREFILETEVRPHDVIRDTIAIIEGS